MRLYAAIIWFYASLVTLAGCQTFPPETVRANPYFPVSAAKANAPVYNIALLTSYNTTTQLYGMNPVWIVRQIQVFQMALDYYNSIDTVIPGLRLNFSCHYTNYLIPVRSINNVIQALQSFPVNAFVSGGFSVEYPGMVSNALGYPFLASTGSLALAPGNPEWAMFPQTISFGTVLSYVATGIADWVYSMGWRNVIVLTTPSLVSSYGPQLASGFIQRAESLGINIRLIQQFVATPSSLQAACEAMVASQTRIFVLFGQLQFLAPLFIEARNYNLTTPDYLWWCSDGSYTLTELQTNLNIVLPANTTFPPVFSLIGPQISTQSTDYQLLNSLYNTSFGVSLNTDITFAPQKYYVTASWESITTLVYAIQKLLNTNPQVRLSDLVSNQVNKLLTPSVFSTNYAGALGPLMFDRYGQKLTSIIDIAYNANPGAIENFNKYDFIEFVSSGNSSAPMLITEIGINPFFNGSSSLAIPLDFPPSLDQGLSQSTSHAVRGFVIFIMATLAASIVFLLRMRTNSVAVFGNVWFYVSVIVGALLIHGSAVAFLSTPLTAQSCNAIPFVQSVGSGIMISAFLSKAHHFWAHAGSNISVFTPVKTASLLSFQGVIFVVNLILSLVLVCQYPLQPTRIDTDQFDHYITCQSSNPNNIQVGMIIFNGALILLTTYALFQQASNAKVPFSENRVLLFGMGNALFLGTAFFTISSLMMLAYGERLSLYIAGLVFVPSIMFVCAVMPMMLAVTGVAFKDTSTRIQYYSTTLSGSGQKPSKKDAAVGIGSRSIVSASKVESARGVITRDKMTRIRCRKVYRYNWQQKKRHLKEFDDCTIMLLWFDPNSFVIIPKVKPPLPVLLLSFLHGLYAW
ncbi:periplasmic binding protein-like I [Polychytrium aggregatum]|uniref:periplasmic binding protein-like I n=1 Tax=Polychytrium aggregatum TaxID=110093 RepID=UPI0022FE338F|nr:periplasmic binding protein-like I [Polychytrium aggregatum]KAI9199706.1 periplasmic binding protein-like I [Polychytrium aggregatum]